MPWLLGVLIVVAGGVFAVVKYLRGAEQNRSDLGERDAALELERQRKRQMEAAAAEARKARRERLHEMAAGADSDGIDRLLRELTEAEDGPNVN
jgi:hypothetical protein